MDETKISKLPAWYHSKRGASAATAKGQLISEELFGVFNFPKTQRKNLTNFYPRI